MLTSSSENPTCVAVILCVLTRKPMCKALFNHKDSIGRTEAGHLSFYPFHIACFHLFCISYSISLFPFLFSFLLLSFSINNRTFPTFLFSMADLKQEFFPSGCWSTSANVREFQHDKQEGIWNKPLPQPPWWKRCYPHHLPAHRLEVGRTPAGGVAQGRRPELQRPRSSWCPSSHVHSQGKYFQFVFWKGKTFTIKHVVAREWAGWCGSKLHVNQGV